MPRSVQRARSAAGASNASPGPLKRLVRRAPPHCRAPCRRQRPLCLPRQLDETEVVSRIKAGFTGVVDDAHVAGSGRVLIVEHAVNLADVEILGSAMLDADGERFLTCWHGSV